MFRLLYIKIQGHAQLGDIEVSFVDKNDESLKPYTTVIIGANGTGKSFLLRTIAEIFRQFQLFKTTTQKSITLPFGFHIRYIYDDVVYEITTSNMILLTRKGEVRGYHFFRNRPLDKPIKDFFKADNEFKIELSEIRFPTRLIVSSVMLNDRFTFSESDGDSFYQYLGVRRTRSLTSTQTFSKKTITYLFDSAFSKTFKDDFAEMLEFMGFEKFFKVHYNTRYNQLFFSGKLNESEFRKFFTQWWESEFTRRDKNSTPWGFWHYEKLATEDPVRIKQIIKFLNYISGSKEKIFNKPKSKSKRFELDMFSADTLGEEFDFIEDLVKLDILSFDGIKIKKKNSEFSVEQSSSGEYHLLLSLLGLYSQIKRKSLILIDEPEISLHPNWQMRYIDFLKKVFVKFPDCHFILTTHSHFIISDLQADSSSVISLSRDDASNILRADLLENKDTYGWSAEEILYTVFRLKTTRNFYLEYDLRFLLHAISTKSQDYVGMKEKLSNVKKLNLSPQDPINLIIDRAEEYLEK